MVFVICYVKLLILYIMLSITNTEFKNYGCPNCGCDTLKNRGCTSYNGCGSGTCMHCGLTFEIRADRIKEGDDRGIKYGVRPENPSDPSKWKKLVHEEAIIIKHPRTNIPAWKWEPEDVRPENGDGEFWKTRGVGYDDVSGFVETKKAGERLLEMVREVLGKDTCRTWLDYRESEPNWIQFKFHSSEFDVERLSQESKELGGVITKDLLLKCKK